jgi:hypothetical protein
MPAASYADGDARRGEVRARCGGGAELEAPTSTARAQKLLPPDGPLGPSLDGEGWRGGAVAATGGVDAAVAGGGAEVAERACGGAGQFGKE